MVGIILNKVVSCFRKRGKFSVFSSQNKWLLCSRKVEILAMSLHVRDRIGSNATIIKMQCIQVTLHTTSADCVQPFH